MVHSNAGNTPERIHVAAAVVINNNDEVLISLRPQHLHQGGLWEFPGGKVEAGESVQVALKRELHEELGIEVQQCRPLIRIPYDYPDKSVLLDVWQCREFNGEPHGKEGQQWRWVAKHSLIEYPFPSANKPIIRAVCLPDRYLITPTLNPTPSTAERQLFLHQLDHSLQSGIRLVQLRAKTLSHTLVKDLALEVLDLCHRHGANLLLNSHCDIVAETAIDGVHLTSQQLQQLTQRPLSATKLVAASCHNAQDLRQAQALGVDFVVLSPVKPTSSHTTAKPIGWETFNCLVDDCKIPVYALGGMALHDLDDAFDHGAQGIAAITSLWET